MSSVIDDFAQPSRFCIVLRLSRCLIGAEAQKCRKSCIVASSGT
ncbi:hypothetical protein [Kitasatospora purpeofusca]|uniref:Uncharacterized protein n=1 Tax=Kitasatospora purpeofusca TaxID=67352 RepID=A0ABZ1U394_9ACTN|nr:hypothetical protein [Kitasatospora purpeofusca]